VRGIYCLEEIVTNEEIPAVPKKNWSRRKKIALTIYSSVVVFLIFLSVFLYLLISIDGVPPPGSYILTTKSSNATATTWTVAHVAVGHPLLKSDLSVIIKNASGTFIITLLPLTVVSGTHGFNYTPALGGDYLSVGDVFSLSKDYTVGCTIILVTPNGEGQCAVLTV
jgi:hypothetical protein